MEIESNKTDGESESANICAKAHQELLQSALYMHTKKVSSAILKAIQTKVNILKRVHNPLQEKQILKKLVNLIWDGMPPRTLNKTEAENRDIENYRYRPNYRNFLPGGARPESYLEDSSDTEEESAGEKKNLQKKKLNQSLLSKRN
ncbi:Fibrous sheath-interacting protein 2 [Plecturocebus cupreus]